MMKLYFLKWELCHNLHHLSKVSQDDRQLSHSLADIFSETLTDGVRMTGPIWYD